jgi:hypothetical protein
VNSAGQRGHQASSVLESRAFCRADALHPSTYDLQRCQRVGPKLDPSARSADFWLALKDDHIDTLGLQSPSQSQPSDPATCDCDYQH